MKFLISLLPIVILATSCASGVKLNSKFCNSRNGVWAKSDEVLDYKVEKNISGFGIEERRLRDILQQRSYKCSEVTKMRVGISQGFFEALLSLIPGYSSQTVTVEFNLEDS